MRRTPLPRRSCAVGTLVWVVAHALTASGGTAQRTLDALVSDTTLENGLQIIALPNPTIPLVTIQVTIRNGAFTQTDDDVGIAHLLEHMLFRSFGRDGFAREADRIDASYNGTTSDETVTYYITLPAANLDRGMKLMADLMREPRFNATDLVAEQRVVLGELQRSASDPNYLLSAMVDQRLWGDGWNRKNPIGFAQTIFAPKPADLRRVYDRFYVPNNAAVVVTGDVTPADVFALAARHFGRWRHAADPFDGLEVPPMPPLQRHQQVSVTLDANDVTLLIRWQGPSVRADPTGAYAADLFAAIVNDRVSDLQNRLVDTGLFHSVSMGYVTRAHVGPVSIRATTTADQLVDASAALHAELTRFADPAYVTPEALEIAKKRQEVDWAMEMETPSDLAWFVGDLWSVAGGLDFVRGYINAMKTMQEQDLESFVGTYLTGRPRVIGILASPRTRHELGPRLQAALTIWRQ